MILFIFRIFFLRIIFKVTVLTTIANKQKPVFKDISKSTIKQLKIKMCTM